jgi:hypothetical protein
MGLNCGNYDGVCFHNECMSEIQYGWTILMEHWNEIFGTLAVLLVLGVLIWTLIMMGPMVKRDDANEL